MPSTQSIIRAALLAGVVSAASVDLQPRQMVTDHCADVHMFLARGNNEPYPGRQGKLVSAVCNGLKSCDYEDIQFHNPGGAPYCPAVSEGTANGLSQIISYNKRCPDSKLVVSGYSQGAHVAGDIFGGGGGSFFQGCTTEATPNLPFNTPAGQAIAAIVTFGDVRHTANQPYNYLDGATHWGLFPRDSQQLANAATFAGVWRDYCHAADPICGAGKDVQAHLNYFDVDTIQAAEFIHEKLAGAADDGSRPASPSTTKPPGSVNTVTALPHGGAPYGGNQTVTYGAGQTSSTVITVTDTAGSTVYVTTTVCPATFSYISNPTEETKPASLSVTQEYPLPEATVTTGAIDLSAVPSIATGTVPVAGATSIVVGGGNVPANATITTAGPVPTSTGPVVGGAASTIAKLGGVSAVALLAVVALL